MCYYVKSITSKVKFIILTFAATEKQQQKNTAPLGPNQVVILQLSIISLCNVL